MLQTSKHVINVAMLTFGDVVGGFVARRRQSALLASPAFLSTSEQIAVYLKDGDFEIRLLEAVLLKVRINSGIPAKRKKPTEVNPKGLSN